MTTVQRSLSIGIVLALIGAGAGGCGDEEAPPATPAGPATRPATATAPAGPPDVPVPTTRRAPEAEVARAISLMERALQQDEADEVVEARSLLADALNTNALPPKDAETGRQKLAGLAQETLFSPRCYKDDPCTFLYKFKPGDRLAKVERELKLHVPVELIARINGIPDPDRIQARQVVKLIRGPFHAVVSKSRFTMDMYLAEHGTGRMIFVKRYPVGVGEGRSTPVGRWRVALGRKRDKAPWTPPASSPGPRKKIFWGQKGYPLGAKGYWIALEGIDGNVFTADDGYGIHGTNERESIGKATSLGCIRLVDEDIEEIYAMLYEHWSTVTVVK